jgi:transcriptional regulator with XRE-family HTH domain
VIVALRDERIRQNISQAALCERVGMAEGRIQRWESGTTTPSFSLLVRWADALGVKIVTTFD